MKKLTNQEIEQLFAFTKKHLVEHYDVQVELVDHLANAIEAQWNENPNISFEDALQTEYKNFGVFGFSGLVEQKQASLQQHYWNIIKKEMISFFSIPKILFSVALFVVLFQFFKQPTELKEMIGFGLNIAIVAATVLMLIYQNRQLKKSKKKYLLHAICKYFYSAPLLFIVYFRPGMHIGKSIAAVYFDAILSTLYLLFCIILFTKIIPMLKNEIQETEQKFQTI